MPIMKCLIYAEFFSSSWASNNKVQFYIHSSKKWTNDANISYTDCYVFLINIKGCKNDDC